MSDLEPQTSESDTPTPWRLRPGGPAVGVIALRRRGSQIQRKRGGTSGSRPPRTTPARRVASCTCCGLPATSPQAELCAVAALECGLETVGATRPVFRTFDLRGELTAKRLHPGDFARNP